MAQPALLTPILCCIFMKSLPEIFEEAASLDAPLSARLAHFDLGLRASGLAWSAEYDALVARLQSAESGSGAPAVGEPFPPFLLPDEHDRLVSSQDLLAAGPLVVSFNRGHWCEFCQLELRALQQISPHIEALGANIVAITPELNAGGARCKIANKLSFPVLCDLDLECSLSLGLAIPVGERIRDLLSADGVSLSQLQGGPGWLLPIPATFVIASDGTIAARYVDSDFRRRMEMADILAALKTA